MYHKKRTNEYHLHRRDLERIGIGTFAQLDCLVLYFHFEKNLNDN